VSLGRLAVVLPVALLLVAAWYQGAFAVRHWAPVAVLALVILSVAAWRGGLRVSERATRAAVGALWALASWALLSALWAESPSGAVEGAARIALYAALFTIAATLVTGGRGAARLGAVAALGVGAIAVVTTVQLLGDGSDLFLAGRLDDPVGYRNATACLFALAFWPYVATAARHDANAVLRAFALAGAVLVLGLAFLTQARGVVLALAVGGAVALALGPDRLRGAWTALVPCAAIAIASGALLTPYETFSDTGAEASAADVATAVDALVLVTVLMLLAGLAVAVLDGGLRLHGPARSQIRRALAAGLAVAAAVAAGGLVAAGDPVDFVDARQQEFRGLETAATGSTRLTFGGGQRSDLWRVALVELGDRPLTGVGEGSYRFGYYEERRSDRNLSEPHSFVFKMAAELGAVGLLLLALFAGGVGAAIASRWRGAAASARRHCSALLAAGSVGLAQGAVDWLWLVPGVTGLSMVALGLAIAVLRPEEERSSGEPPADAGRPRLAGRVAAGAALLLAAAAVASVYLGDVYLRDARAISPARPTDRLEAAERAERLSPFAVAPLYLQAGALEDLRRRRAARSRLREALDREPRNFVTLALLGDLEVRADRPRAARGRYRQALALNPLDVGLRQLARDAGR
jgi:hypothetical protein